MENGKMLASCAAFWSRNREIVAVPGKCLNFQHLTFFGCSAVQLLVDIPTWGRASSAYAPCLKSTEQQQPS